MTQQVKAETCENCGRGIGRLETPRLFKEAVVCIDCWQRLSADEPRPIMYATPAPARTMYTDDAASRVRTVQQTSKIWKLQMLLAAVLTIYGIVVAIQQGTSESPDASAQAKGFLAIVGGVAWLLFARFMAWWFHG